jgi:predicted MFS family arabinose efflux permease
MRLPNLRGIYRNDSKPAGFLLTLLFSGICAGLYKGIQDNYLAEIVHINEFGRGIVEFFREIPGLLVVVLLAWMYRFSETRVFKLGAAGMCLGMLGLFGFPPGKVLVVLAMVVYSTGEHIIMPVRTTMSLNLARSGKEGLSLGLTSALSHGGNIAGFLAVMAVLGAFKALGFSGSPGFPFKAIFGISAVFGAAALLISLTLRDSGTAVKRRRLYFASKFHKYYMLEVFYGARKQIFITFAPYVLILHYGADASVISLLMAVCAVFGFLFSPFIGKLIDRLGYKFIMITDTLLLVVVCLFYGFAHRIFPFRVAFFVVCANYILDSVISLASMASNVYVKAIASSQEEITATLSTGISVNHLISILIALLGGWIWKATGIEVLFSLSAFLGILNSIYAATIKANPR